MATTTDPTVSYEQSVQTAMASGNPQTSLVGYLGAAAAPSVAQTESQVASIEQQLGDLGPSLGLQTNYANLMAGYQLGGLGIQAQQQGLSMAGTTQQYNLQQQGFQQTAQEQQLNAERQLQGAIGGAASTGALNTVGSKQQQADIGQQYAWEKASLGRQEELSAGDYARAQANYGLMAQANGISQQEVYSRLQYGLQQMGIAADPSSLVSQAGQAMSQGGQDIGGVLSQAGLLGGMNALSSLGS